jgi:conjugal transfer/entry exclusion protein
MRRIKLLILTADLFIWAVPAHAQLPVQELGQNLFYNSVQAADAVVNTASWLLNLAGFETFAITYGTLTDDLNTLRQLVNDGSQLAWDVGSLQGQLDALFNIEHAPYTSAGIAARQWQVQQVLFQSYSYAMRTQTLIRTTLGVVNDIEQLAIDLLSILGEVNGAQELAQQQSRLLHLQAELKVQTTAFQRAQSMEAIYDPMLERALQNFNETVWATQP